MWWLVHRLESFLYIIFLCPFPRFRPISVFREADEDESGFMCCAFSARERFLMLGTCTGQLKLYNVFTGQEEASYSCHSSAITHLEPSRVSRGSYLYINSWCQNEIIKLILFWDHRSKTQRSLIHYRKWQTNAASVAGNTKWQFCLKKDWNI